MPNTIEDFLHALKRTINGDPYPQKNARNFAAISYKVVRIKDPLEDQVLANRYRVKSRIGKGSMACVYKAVQEPIERVVAIKVLKREWSLDPANVKRFNREAKTVSALKHRNILSILDIGSTDYGQPFFVMEYLDGISLEQLIEKRGPIPIARAIPIFCQVCDGMSEAHLKGLIHRDLKPANVMLITEEDGRELVKLVDFGIVQISKDSQLATQKLTQKGEIWGSPIYMSPEQCMGLALDARSDIYSLGIVMYESLLGVQAFSDKAPIGSIVNWQLSKMPDSFKIAAANLRIPERLEEIVFRALQKKPEDRYRSMDELKHDLETFGKQHGIKMRMTMGVEKNPAISHRAGTAKATSANAQIERPKLSEAKQTLNRSARTNSVSEPIQGADDKNTTASGFVPSTNQIKLLIGLAVFVLLIALSAVVSIPIFLSNQGATKNVNPVPKESTNKNSKTGAPSRTEESASEPDKFPAQSKSGSKQENKNNYIENNSALSPDSKPNSSSSAGENGASDHSSTKSSQEQNAQLKKSTIKVLKTQKRSRPAVAKQNSTPENEDAMLESIYLKKHKSDATHQWMKIQQQEKE